MDIYEFTGAKPIGAAAGQKIHKLKGEAPPEGWVTSLKYDGVSGIFVKHKGVTKMFSLSGKELSNTSYLLEQLGDVCTREGWVLFGEIVGRNMTLEQLSGILNPNTKREYDTSNLMFFVFDAVSVEEYVAGVSNKPWSLRQWDIPLQHSVDFFQRFDTTVEIARESGMEGVVCVDPNGPWLRGKRVRHTLKKVFEPRFDLEIVRVEEGKGKREGMTGRLVVMFRGNEINVDLGKGFSEKDRRLMWHHREKYVGQIADVKCLKVSSTGTNLRLAKVEAIRFDTVAEENK